MKIFYLLKIALFIVLCFGITATWAEQPVQTMPPAQTTQAEWARAVSPEENSVVIGKKPAIKIEFMKPVAAGTLVVMLDGTDVTQMSSITEKGFEYKPVMVLAPGAHTLNMMAKDGSGLQLQKAVSFTTRHSESFEEARSDNELSVLYERPLKKPRFAGEVPDSRVEGNLRSDTKLREKEWEMTFSTNLRYLDQDLPVFQPFNKGISIANYLLQTKYSKDLLQVTAEVGDIQVNETQNTAAGLARRGGRFAVQYKDFTFNTFIVKGINVFGFHQGLGLDPDLADHIFGMSAGLKLLDRKVEFRTIYLTGGEPMSSPGISTTPGSRKGEVLGLVLATDFFQNRLRSEFEADFSSYDPDTSDEFGDKGDRAYRAKLSGAEGRYVYDAAFEYFGRDYASIGSQGSPRDRSGFMAHGGANYELHDINVTFSRYHDNVKGDELFPRIVNYMGMIDYNVRLIPNTPLGISYSRNILDSSREPDGSTPMDIHTDTISGRVSRSIDKLNLMFMTTWSSMNDRTPANNDSTMMSYTLTPSFSAGSVMISSNLQLNQSKFRATDVRTDTYTLTLDLRTKFLNDKASFDLNATYNIIKADNNSTDMKNLMSSFRLGYILKELFSGLVKPNIALRGTYMKITDNINTVLNRDDFSLFLVLSTVTPFSL